MAKSPFTFLPEMKNLLAIVALGIAFGWPLVPVAQLSPMLQARHITEREGLPADEVNDITQDQRGIVWMATGSGVIGFDGTTFIRPFPDTLPRLFRQTEFIKILWEGDDVLWGGTAASGLFRWDRRTGKMDQFLHDPNDPGSIHANSIQLLFQDPDGRIWAGANGLCRYEPVSGNFLTVIPFQDEDILRQNNNFQLLFYDAFTDPYHPDWLYLVAAKGICHFNYKTFEAEYFFESKELTAVQRACQDSAGDIWMADWGLGLCRFSIRDKSFTRFRCNELGISDNRCLNAGGIIAIEKNSFLLSIWGGGLMIFDATKSRFHQVVVSGESSCHELAARTLFKDRDGGIWILSQRDGLFFSPVRFQEVNRLFIGEQVTDVHFHPGDHRLYFCTATGTACSFNPDLQDFKAHPIKGLSKKPWLCKFQSSQDDQLWLLGTNNLFHLVPDHHFQPLAEHAWQQALGRFGYFWDMVIDKGQHIWVSAQNGGLGEWSIPDHTFSLHQQLRNDPNSLAYDYSIGTLYLDHRNQVWGAGEGIFYFNTRDRKFTNLPPAVKTGDAGFHTSRAFTVDSLSYLWLGSELDMLFRIHTDSLLPMRFERVRFDQHLPNSPVHSMYTDQEGIVWITSEAGLTRIIPQELTAVHFGSPYGLEALGEMTSLPGGRMVVAAENGLLEFDFNKMGSPINRAHPYITAFEVMGKPRHLPAENETIRLQQHQHFFAFEFSAIDLSGYSTKYFAYKLDGFDPDWVESGNRKYVSYTNIRSGQYTFRVKVRDETGLWSEEQVEVNLTIVPPFYQSWWFWTLAGITLLLGMYGLYQYRVRQIRKEERLKTDFHKQIAAVEMNALRAQMNPHFLFNSLNAIKFYVVKKSPEKAAEYLDNFARLIRLILQNSREQKIPLSQELETLQLYIEMERLRFEEGFDVEVEIDPALDTDYILLPPLLLQPYVENAIWHGLLHRSEKGKLTLRAYRLNGSICIEIEDNGIGRHKAALLKSKSAQQKKSMGMQLTKERMDINQILSNTKTTVVIEDLVDEFGHARGTKVIVTMNHPDTVNT